MKVVKQYTNLTLRERVQMLNDLEAMENVRVVMRKYEVSQATVYNVRRNAAKIRAQKAQKRSSKTKRVRLPKFEAIDRELIQAFKVASKSNPSLPISNLWMQQKAKTIAEGLGISVFEASDCWVSAFKQRHKLSTKRTCGEASKVDQEEIDAWLNEHETVLNAYPLEDIFNADETGFFYKMLPNRSIHFKGEPCHAGEQSKDRFTALLFANFRGTEKLTPLIIGHSRNPRCFPRSTDLKEELGWTLNCSLNGFSP